MIDTKYDIKYVAIYLRKSRGEEEDLQKHETVLTDICKKNNWRYIEYKEIGTSDSIELRPQMQKLLGEIEKDLYDAVLVVDYDRLSRGDMGQQDRIKKIFRKSNTLIITPQKIYDLNNDIDDTYTDFQGLLARQEYKMITKRLRQGKKIGARMGNWTNGIPPYPYEYERYKDKYNEKGLVVNDEKLQIYRYIVEKALDNISPNEIAWDLNRQKLPSPRGKNWSNVTIYRMLIDETHLGRIISNKQKGDAHKIKKQSSEEYRKLPREEWVVVENCHEPVKSLDEHEKLKMMLDRRRLIPLAARASKGDLSGILKCSICGSSMGIYKNKSGEMYLKPCWHKDEFGNKCENRGGKANIIYQTIRKSILEYKDEITNNLNNTLDDRELIFIRKQLNIQFNELEKYNKAIERVQDSFDLGDYNREEFLERKSKWENKISDTENEIERLEKLLKSQEQAKNQEKLYCIEKFLENIDELKDAKDRNNLYKTLLDSVVWKRINDEEPELEINFL